MTCAPGHRDVNVTRLVNALGIDDWQCMLTNVLNQRDVKKTGIVNALGYGGFPCDRDLKKYTNSASVNI